MKIKYIYIFFLSCFFADECFDNWISNNPILNNSNFHLKANVNNNTIQFFNDISEKRFRVDTNKFILISDEIKISKFILNNNQLYIDKKDEKFEKYIQSFFNFPKLKRKIKKASDNIYRLDNKLSKSQSVIYFDTECQFIDSIIIRNDDYKLFIKEIQIDSIYDIDSDSLFNFNLDLEKIEVYDFR